MDFFFDFADWFRDFFSSGDDFPGFFAHIYAWLVIWWIELKIVALQYTWQIAQVVLIQLDISGPLNAAWASLDSELLGYITYFRLPEAFNIIINARITRFILNMMGW